MINNNYNYSSQNKTTTSKQITFNSLDSSFLDTSTNKINIEAIKEEILLYMDNVQNINIAMYNNRVKAYAPVWYAFEYLANIKITDIYNKSYYATSQQLKDYLKSYGYDFKTIFLDLIEVVENNRIERKQENEKIEIKCIPFNVYLNKKLIDTVYYNSNISKDEIRTSLINHDNYDNNIVVTKARK